MFCSVQTEGVAVGAGVPRQESVPDKVLLLNTLQGLNYLNTHTSVVCNTRLISYHAQ